MGDASSVLGGVPGAGSLPGYNLRVLLRSFALVSLLVLAPCLSAQSPSGNGESSPAPAGDETSASEASADATAPAAGAAGADRARLNLLGEVNSEQGEGRRNENVQLALIDNNVLAELQQRMGATATIVKTPKLEQSYWATEYGAPPARPFHLPRARGGGVHGNVFWSHTNSALAARSFFQVGEVQPARNNNYGFTVGTPLWKGAHITVNASQTFNRGQVNGNVLVPSADERTPLTNDPRILPVVQRILAAYPVEVPNRTDINPRALNTNSPQNITNDRIGATLNQDLGGGRLTARYNFVGQSVEAFQLVGGMNPDTTTRNHSARITWTRAWSPKTTSDVSVGFDRVGSLLVPEETSIGPWMRLGQLTGIGPPGRFPVDRAGNTFRYAARTQHRTGDHTLTVGLDLARLQINGSEFQDHRGQFNFRNDFGRNPIDNLRMGTPSRYSVAIGNIDRGFRQWRTQLYFGDQWKASANLTLDLGLRWEPVTTPSEVNGLTEIPYSSDLNNWAPRFGFAYRLPEKWGTLRGGFGVHYGEVFTATYIQARINPPQNLTVVVQSPDLADPLKDLQPEDLDPNARTTLFDIAPDLATPYSYTYNFGWEVTLPRDWTLELGYVGNRSHKLLSMYYLNRAVQVEGIPQTTRTVNQRRPDPDVFEIQHINNGSRGYFDAGKAVLRIPRWRGLTMETAYWWSKAIDLGGSYLNTASNANRRQTDSPSEFDVHGELRGLSNFDQPHAFLWNFTYQSPALAQAPAWTQKIFGSWQLSMVTLLKAGTPFSVRAGSDAPGFGNVDGRPGDSALLLDPSVLGRSADHPDTAADAIPRSAFDFIAPTDLRGNLGRNTFRRDGIANVNMAVSRQWPLAGDTSLLFRAESLNFTNHPQFAEPGLVLAQNNFGRITNTLNDGRAFKFTLRLTF